MSYLKAGNARPSYCIRRVSHLCFCAIMPTIHTSYRILCSIKITSSRLKLLLPPAYWMWYSNAWERGLINTSYCRRSVPKNLMFCLLYVHRQIRFELVLVAVRLCVQAKKKKKMRYNLLIETSLKPDMIDTWQGYVREDLHLGLDEESPHILHDRSSAAEQRAKAWPPTKRSDQAENDIKQEIAQINILAIFARVKKSSPRVFTWSSSLTLVTSYTPCPCRQALSLVLIQCWPNPNALNSLFLKSSAV